MNYQNPVVFQDFSDPDVIRRGDHFYMIASSFNHTPGVPVLKSVNLVDWKIIGYVFNDIPFERFNDVCHGDGAWAPALRYYKGTYYAVIPFPYEGIYVSSCIDIDKGNWTKPWCLVSGKGLIDPCPVWIKDKAYLAIGFAKSRIGFNSCLGLYEVSQDLKTNISGDYKIIYDGHHMNPTIEGPKFNLRNGYIYIMAPAGSVKSGWQVCLRSKDINGPYEAKIVLMQNDSPINGPHQGALIDLKDDKWAFIHFQDRGCYGRIIHLQPVKWVNDWPMCGNVKDELIAGTPVLDWDYIIDKKSNYRLETSDDFNNDELSLIWQTPANKLDGWYKLDNGLVLNCYYHDDKSYKSLNLCPNLFLTKLSYPSFKCSTLVELNLVNDGDEVGLCYMGQTYQYICVKRIDGKNHLQIKQGEFNNDCDVVLFDSIYLNKEIEFNLNLFEKSGIGHIDQAYYQLGFNKTIFKEKYQATAGRWIGGKIGVYAKGLETGGFARFKHYKVKEVK